MWKMWLVSHRFYSCAPNDVLQSQKSTQRRRILLGDRYHKDESVIMRKPLKKRCISEDAYRGLIDVYTGKKLLETNVFAFRVNSEEISFQSTLMKRFCEENPALWKRLI